MFVNYIPGYSFLGNTTRFRHNKRFYLCVVIIFTQLFFLEIYAEGCDRQTDRIYIILQWRLRSFRSVTVL